MTRTGSTRLSRAAGMAAILLLSSCATPPGSAGKVTAWNPMTWFSGSEGRTAARADAKLEGAREKALEAAQKTAHETAEALAVAPASRPVEVARESATATVTMLDQAQGPLTAAEATRIRRQIEALVSENAALRKQGEKLREEERGQLLRISEQLDRAERARDKATGDLQAAFARENELANTLRNQRFIIIAAGILAAIGYLGFLYLRFAYGGIPEAIGRGLSELRMKHPTAGDAATQIFDQYLNRREQTAIAKHS